MNRDRLPLRWKLTLWYLSLFGVIQVSLLVGAMLFRQNAIREAFQDDLRRWSAITAQRIAALDRAWSERDLERAIPMGSEFLLCAIRDRQGAILLSTGEFDAAALPPIARSADSSRYHFTTVRGEVAARLAKSTDDLRLVSLQFEDASGEPYFLHAAVSARRLRALPSLAVDLFLIGVPVGLLACGVAAWMLAARAVSPIVRMSERVSVMTPQNLDSRIDVPAADAEVARLQDELNRALRRIEIAFLAQEQFISNVSHELKTPISVLLSEAQVLLALPARDRINYREFASSVVEEMRRLGQLVESFLTLARAHHEGLARREPVSINDLVLESIHHCAPLAERAHVRLVAKLDDTTSALAEPETSGDPELLRSLIDNLVRNAIRFSPREGAVHLHVAITDGWARIEVLDEGPGVPEALHATLFDRFVQGPQRSRGGGLGLGLAIARSVADLHGGRIGLQNRPQGGCCFWVDLPLTGGANTDMPGSPADAEETVEVS
jgi:signal transduction histidine kinase